MKKTIMAILCILLVIFPAITVFAETENIVTINITSDKHELKEGEKFTVNTAIQSPVGMGGFQFDLHFDTTRVKLTKLTLNKSTKDKGSLECQNSNNTEAINEAGYIRVLYLYGGSGAMKKKDDLMVMEFEVLESCTSGTSAFELKNVTVGDTDAKKMTVAKAGVAVSITGTKSESSSSSASSEPTSSEVSSDTPTSSTPASDTPTSSESGNEPEKKSGGSGLSDLVIDGEKVDFDSEKTEIEINTDKPSIDIGGIPVDENASVVVEGGDNLKEGENDVKITVTDEDGRIREYNVKVNYKRKLFSITTLIIVVAAAAVIALIVTAAVITIKRKK